MSNAPLFVQGVGNLTIGSVITGTSGGLTKAGGGALDFTTVQNYTGTTTINGGDILRSSPQALTNTLIADNTLVVNAGGTLWISMAVCSMWGTSPAKGLR